MVAPIIAAGIRAGAQALKAGAKAGAKVAKKGAQVGSKAGSGVAKSGVGGATKSGLKPRVGSKITRFSRNPSSAKNSISKGLKNQVKQQDSRYLDPARKIVRQSLKNRQRSAEVTANGGKKQRLDAGAVQTLRGWAWFFEITDMFAAAIDPFGYIWDIVKIISFYLLFKKYNVDLLEGSYLTTFILTIGASLIPWVGALPVEYTILVESIIKQVQEEDSQ